MAFPSSTLATLIIAGTALTGSAAAVIANTAPSGTDTNLQQVVTDPIQAPDSRSPEHKIKVLAPNPIPTLDPSVPNQQTPIAPPDLSNGDDDSWNGSNYSDDDSWGNSDDDYYEDDDDYRHHSGDDGDDDYRHHSGDDGDDD